MTTICNERSLQDRADWCSAGMHSTTGKQSRSEKRKPKDQYLDRVAKDQNVRGVMLQAERAGERNMSEIETIER